VLSPREEISASFRYAIFKDALLAMNSCLATGLSHLLGRVDVLGLIVVSIQVGVSFSENIYKGWQGSGCPSLYQRSGTRENYHKS